MKCEVDGCEHLAKWNLYKTMPSGEKVWLNVCTKHEKEVGDENLRRIGASKNKGAL